MTCCLSISENVDPENRGIPLNVATEVKHASEDRDLSSAPESTTPSPAAAPDPVGASSRHSGTAGPGRVQSISGPVLTRREIQQRTASDAGQDPAACLCGLATHPAAGCDRASEGSTSQRAAALQRSRPQQAALAKYSTAPRCGAPQSVSVPMGGVPQSASVPMCNVPQSATILRCGVPQSVSVPRCEVSHSAGVAMGDVLGSGAVPSEPSRAPVMCGTLPSDTTPAADCFRPVPGLPTPADTSSRPEPALSCACSQRVPVCPAATPLTGGGDSAPRQPAEATTPEPACDGQPVLSGGDGPLVADPPEGARVPAALPPPGRPRAIRVGLSKRAQLRPLHVRRPR